ncbi:MAG: NHL repeat-containing protein [Coriobacteriia bacterium]|nr:NHL repeat-containing protein [Coriobacteriia bacterium]
MTDPRSNPYEDHAAQPSQEAYELVASRETAKRRRRQLFILGILLTLLALVAYATYYYMVNRRLPLPGAEQAEQILPPQFLYAISGPPGADALARPIGVAVGKDDLVYATDTKARVVRVYTSDGKYRFTISEIADGEDTALQAPAHLAVGPGDDLYVSDRRLRAVYVFDADGKYKRKILPDGPEAEFWAPLGMGFDAEGNLYVTDAGINEKHRVIVFDPSGREIRRFGKTGRAEIMSDFPGQFYFPNGAVIAEDGSVFISDSNNRRVQVFTPTGEYERILRTSGIPRGVAIDEQARLYVVDALSHSVDVFDLSGKLLTGFGSGGVGPGQFRYANDVALDSRGRIYVSDRENHQIQVWGWPVETLEPPALPGGPLAWLACLAPLLLLPLLLLLRKRTYVLSGDYVEAAVEAGLVERMADMRRTRFVVPLDAWDAYSGRMVEGRDLGQVIQPEAHSDTDARSLQERMNVEHPVAVLLAMGERSKRMCTLDPQLKALAGALNVEVFGLELLTGEGKRR